MSGGKVESIKLVKSFSHPVQMMKEHETCSMMSSY